MFQIFQEFSLVNSTNRTQTHRYGWELPEFRHQFRVRIGREAIAVTSDGELSIRAALESDVLPGKHERTRPGRCGPGSKPGRRHPARCVHEEVVKAHIINGCGRLEGRHVAAQFEVFFDARRTVMMAFQRIAERIRRSSSRLPGYSGCSSTGMVLM